MEKLHWLKNDNYYDLSEISYGEYLIIPQNTEFIRCYSKAIC